MAVARHRHERLQRHWAQRKLLVRLPYQREEPKLPDRLRLGRITRYLKQVKMGFNDFYPLSRGLVSQARLSFLSHGLVS